MAMAANALPSRFEAWTIKSWQAGSENLKLTSNWKAHFRVPSLQRMKVTMKECSSARAHRLGEDDISISRLQAQVGSKAPMSHDRNPQVHLPAAQPVDVHDGHLYMGRAFENGENNLLKASCIISPEVVTVI